jgi:cytochrome c-type biogenesis protein CcmH/NrfF
VACAALLGAPSASAVEPKTSLPDIEDEVMCTICGTVLEQSQAPQAERQRALIRRLIAQGQTKEQIKDALVAEYGEQVLATPSGGGFDLAAWLVPGLGLLLGVLGIGFAVRRARARSTTARAEEPAPLDPEENRRLDADLAREDL